MKGKAAGAVVAQSVQAAISLVLQLLVIRLLGIEDYGRFAILYGVIVLATAVVTGLIGDSLVVLDRADRRVRAGLEGLLLWVSLTLVVVAGGVTGITGFLDVGEAIAFAVALGLFAVEEIVRRMLMVHLSFLRVAAIDLAGFGCALVVLVLFWVMPGLSLLAVLVAIGTGQAVACVIGWFLLPRLDRVLVSLRDADYRSVWAYGTWRALQQVLRPGMFTIVRLLVLAFAGLAAVGLLEAARAYTSPLIIVVGGMSSFLFVRFAAQHKAGGLARVRDADKVVLLLIGMTIVMSLIALVLAPWIGPLLFDVSFETGSVIAWLVYGLSVAIVTPYGALGAVTGRQTAVFLIRFGDTVLGIAGAALFLAAGGHWGFVPLVLAVASALGGGGLRWLAGRPTPPSAGSRTGAADTK